jgi:hypothetical protein
MGRRQRTPTPGLFDESGSAAFSGTTIGRRPEWGVAGILVRDGVKLDRVAWTALKKLAAPRPAFAGPRPLDHMRRRFPM